MTSTRTRAARNASTRASVATQVALLDARLPSLASDDPEAARTFAQQARTLARLATRYAAECAGDTDWP